MAAFYQAKGYTVREGVRVPGLSGNEHRVPLLAEGPLGSLAVFFGDFGGVDGPEMGGARKAARDIGATPVLAADEFSNADRQVASKLGVVLLDGSMMQEDAPARPPAAAWPGLQINAPRRRGAVEPDAHPWPASGRSDGAAAGPAADLDIDDLLAETRPKTASPDLEAAADRPPATPAAPPAAVARAPAEPAGDSLWRKPRSAAATPSPTPAPARAAGTKFAWLDGGAPAPSREAEMPGYDGVVAARVGTADGAEEPVPPGPRLGDEAELQPTVEELERRKRRDRLQRRLFWLLFVFTFLYLGYLFWTNQLFN